MSTLERIIRKNKELFLSVAIKFLHERKNRILKELSDIERKIKEFERKYGCFESFSSSLPNDFEYHEIWFEWKSLLELKKELEKELKDIEDATKEIIRGK